MSEPVCPRRPPPPAPAAKLQHAELLQRVSGRQTTQLPSSRLVSAGRNRSKWPSHPERNSRTIPRLVRVATELGGGPVFLDAPYGNLTYGAFACTRDCLHCAWMRRASGRQPINKNRHPRKIGGGSEAGGSWIAQRGQLRTFELLGGFLVAYAGVNIPVHLSHLAENGPYPCFDFPCFGHR